MHTQITIYGTIGGHIWMPSALASKEFETHFTTNGAPFTREWHGLRDALLHITNDGDFSSCGIVDAYISVKRITTDAQERVHFHTIQTEIKPEWKLTSDLFLSESEREEIYTAFADYVECQ